MTGRNVIITGCSSGIGYCVAQGLRDRGYRVLATARKQDAVDRLTSLGFETFQLDLSNSVSIQSVFKKIINITHGNIYAVFNNGAYGQPGAVEDLSREVLREQFEVNLFGTHELTNLVLPVMRTHGKGRIIQNSSVLGFVALKYRGAYNASKYALEGLTDTLRLELKGTGIFISLIEPGPILSNFRANAYNAFQQNIDRENSCFKDEYEKLDARFNKEGAVDPFTLGPEAVLKKVIHALESERPKDRYYVTFPTYLFACMKRLFPGWMVDKILERI